MTKPDASAVNTDEPVFEDSPTMPRGRKARVISPALQAALEDSAKRGVAKVVTGGEILVGALLSDLGSATVKRQYTVTTETESLPGNKRKLTFSAVAKSAE